MSAAIPHTPPSTISESPSVAQAVSPEGLRHGNDSEGSEELKRRTTIAERMAKLGAIKFGAPLTHRMQPPATAVPMEGAGMEGSTAGSGQPVSEEPQEPEEEDEQARRERISAKIAGMGGMRVGMLPVHPSIGVALPPPPPVSVRREEEVMSRSPPRAIPPPPPSQPAALLSEYDHAYEHPSSSDDGVQVEAEESEIEEVCHEDLEDEYDVTVATEEEEQAPQRLPSHPPPPPRATRPPIPLARPPVPPTGRRFSTEAPSTPRSGSFDPVTSVPRPVAWQPTSDFVMVEADEAAAQTARPGVPVRGPPPPRAAPPPPELSDSVGAGGSGTGQWELPSIPSGSLDFGDSIGISNDLSASMWSEDSTAYPPTTVTVPSSAPPPPHSVQPRAPVGPPARMTVDELRAAWDRVGVYVAEAASGLLERSKRTLVGNGSYEGFVAEVLAQVPNASPPHAPGEYGFLVYAQTGAQVHTRLADIMPGDVVVLRGARLKGHKGLQSYNMSAGESAPCVGVVSEFDAKKVKLKALQANQRVGQAVRTNARW
jgi:myosin tail region-interacting protein MTI1